MPQVCRIGDTGKGVCYQHKSPRSFTTTFITGDSTTSANGSPVVTVGCLGNTTCGHTTQATQGSSTVAANGNPVHRVGDIGIVIGGGHYEAITGSPDVLAGD